MIEGYLPGLVRVDPVGVAPAEVVRLAARCERLEAVAGQLEAERDAFRRKPYHGPEANAFNRGKVAGLSFALAALDAALVAAGATGKAGT